MGTILANKNAKKCALCAHWNGAMGSTTITPVYSGNFKFDRDEKKPCFKKSVPTPSWNTCPFFSPRYK